MDLADLGRSRYRACKNGCTKHSRLRISKSNLGTYRNSRRVPGRILLLMYVLSWESLLRTCMLPVYATTNQWIGDKVSRQPPNL